MGESGKSVNLTIVELLVLLSLKKVSSIYGLFEEDDNDIDKKDVNESLFKMIKKGILIQKDNVLSVNATVDMILDDIINATKILTVSGKEETVPEQSIYIGKNKVLLRFDGNGSKRVHIRTMDTSSIIETIMNCGFSLTTNVSSLIVGEGKVDDPDESFKTLFETKRNLVLEQQFVSSVATLSDISTQTKLSQITLLNKGIEDYIVYDDNASHEVYQYSDEMLEKYMGILLEE